MSATPVRCWPGQGPENRSRAHDRIACHPQLVLDRIPPPAATRLLHPASANEAVEQLEALGSPVKAFVRERCSVGPGHSVPVELIYQDWRMWCENNGRREPGTKQSFGRDLKAAVPGLRISQPRQGEDRVRVYEGISLETRI
jgi:phage/plasmid-associated DNA primase